MKVFRRKGRKIRHAVCTCLTLVLTVSGCADQYAPVVMLDEGRSSIAATHSEFSEMAKSSDLPAQYVSEGKIGVAKVEATLETADAVDLNAQAELNKKLADFSARRKEIEAKASRELSEADALRQKYNKEYSKALAQISAREAELEALISRKDTIVSSLAKEGNSKCNDIIANGQEKFESEKARIEQIKEVYNAIEAESNAKILEMVEASKATRERASATVQELESQAASAKMSTAARVSELGEQIKSSEIQTNAEAERLKVARETLLKDTDARIKELRTKADTIEANLASEEYKLQLTKAESERAAEEAKTKEKSASVPTRLERAMAEIDRLRADVSHHQEKAVANYDSVIAEIQAKLDDELSEVKKIRVSSDRAEEVARAEFVKAEAAAKAEAIRQTAAHADAVVEAQKLAIIAEAEAEAARIKQEVLDEIAAQKKAGKVEFTNNTTVPEAIPESLHTVPAAQEVAPVAARIEPDHIASYRKSFAEVMSARAKADSLEMVANATFAEAKTKIMAVKTQQDAIAKEKLAIADALEAQARARFSEMELKLEKELDVVESKYNQNLVNAESYRKEKEAAVLDLRSQADALEQITMARAEQLFAEEQAVVNCGMNHQKELEVELWAVQQKGEAEYSNLMTEAKSVNASQEALATQIDAQVASARKYLDAELAKIDNSIQSADRIAQADYQQAMTQANVLRQKIDAEINRTNAQFAMEHSVARTQIERDRQLAMSQHLRSEASCERMIADSTTNKMCENANIDAQYASAEADMNIVLAENSAKRSAAQGYLDAVKARFAARVEQVKAERVIDMANEHNAMVLKRTDLSNALAQAIAAREDSNRKLTALQKRQKELQTASLQNWSDKVAMYKNNTIEFDTFDGSAPEGQMVDSQDKENAPSAISANLEF